MSYDQSKVQLAVWAILAAPFLMSNDLRNIDPEIKELLLNRDIIEVDQDDLGIQGQRIARKTSGIEIWKRPVLPWVGSEYSYAVAFVSTRRDSQPYTFQTTLRELKLTNEFGYKVQVLSKPSYLQLDTIKFIFRISSILRVKHLKFYKATHSPSK